MDSPVCDVTAIHSVAAGCQHTEFDSTRGGRAWLSVRNKVDSPWQRRKLSTTTSPRPTLSAGVSAFSQATADDDLSHFPQREWQTAAGFGSFDSWAASASTYAGGAMPRSLAQASF